MTIGISVQSDFGICSFMMCVGTCVCMEQVSKSGLNTVFDDDPFTKLVLITGTDSIT